MIQIESSLLVAAFRLSEEFIQEVVDEALLWLLRCTNQLVYAAR